MIAIIGGIKKHFQSRKEEETKTRQAFAIANYCSQHDCDTCRYCESDGNCRIQKVYEHND